MRAAFDAALDRLTRVPGVRGALVAAPADGLVVADRLMEGEDGRAAAALVGALLGRLEGAAGAAGLRPAAVVYLRAESGAVLAAPAGPELAVVAILGPAANAGLARLELLAAAGGLA